MNFTRPPYSMTIRNNFSAEKLSAPADTCWTFHSKFIFVLLIGLSIIACQRPDRIGQVRPVADTVSFTREAWQLDSLLSRCWYHPAQRKNLVFAEEYDPAQSWKVVIAPHDDYAYVSSLYPQLFQSLRAKVVIIFGVAHRARLFNIENQLVFDSFPRWHGVYHPIRPHPIREYLLQKLPRGYWLLHDSLQTVEHSVEALLPFIQHFNPKAQIVSILVPAMPFDRMDTIARTVAQAIANYAGQHNWRWGEDFALVISNDAVHYGDEGWGGKNYAPYGCSIRGYQQALMHEKEIIDRCLTGVLNTDRIRLFTQYTVRSDDFREYRWIWCGRYSVPMGLLTAYYLQEKLFTQPRGVLVGYSTSIEPPRLLVRDLKIGLTAPANLHHWVGYAAIGYQ